MKELPKKYNSLEIEKQMQDYWHQNQIYAWQENSKRKDNYVIDTPPPTVSGLLHMGHVFSYVQADFVARYQRMQGKNVFYPMGFDDNGLPTERLVEKVKKIKAANLDREEFIEICKEVSADARKDFRALFESIALSVDWSQEYHTISEESRKISQMSFLDLYQKQDVYQQEAPMFWDPIDQTAISQAEIEDHEHDSFFNNIKFTVKETGEEIIIGTTRPEMLAACVCVFFNPEDERYKHLKDKTAITPLFNAEVPLIEDEGALMDKGTGLVMCCTFGDETDINWWKKHKLPLKIIINKYGKLDINEFSGDIAGQLNGKKIKDARALTIKILEQQNLITKKEAIKHFVKCAERSKSPLEIIPTKQWFIKILDKKEELLKKAQSCNWKPEFMQKRIEQWIEGLSWDWCISRQRYFGVPFPVWYSKRKGEEGKIITASIDELPVNPITDAPKGYKKEEVEPDFDVMDTWATSSVSPQINSKSINKNFSIDYNRHKKLFPADLRPQAHEIIRSWAFYTIVKSYLHENCAPWKNLMISGWCLAEDKTKMSKSKGNVITPVSLIENRSADVVRFWASNSKLGADTAYSEKLLDIGKKLINKLWNASKFTAMQINNLEDKSDLNKYTPFDAIEAKIIYKPMDLWIIGQLHIAIKDAQKAFEKYEYSEARQAIENLFWNDFCDNYLEIVKVRAYDPEKKDPNGQKSAIFTLNLALKTILKLFAPFTPHICEFLYQNIFEEQGSIHDKNSWPNYKDYRNRKIAERKNEGKYFIEKLAEARKYKAENNLAANAEIPEITITQKLDEQDLKNVTNAKSIKLKKEKLF